MQDHWTFVPVESAATQAHHGAHARARSSVAVNRLGAFVAVLGAGLALSTGVAVAQDEEDAPEITDGPRIEGIARVGETLSVAATWTANVESVEWLWWRCGEDEDGDLDC